MQQLRAQAVVPLFMFLALLGCNASRENQQEPLPKVIVTTIRSKTVSIKQQYAGRIQSHRRIEIRAPLAGYVSGIHFKEGQSVKQDELLFEVGPSKKSQAADGQTENRPVAVNAPFDGVVSRLLYSDGAPIRQGETVTTLSDNSQIWVYINIPERRYLEFKSANLDQHTDDLKIELVLANGKKFDQPGKFGAIGTDFNPQTGNVSFRADFPNPDRQLFHGQTCTVLISYAEQDSITVPQRATFEIDNKRYVYVVDKDHVAHQREIVLQSELDDVYVVKSGVSIDERVIVDDLNKIHDGDKVDDKDLEQQKSLANVTHPGP